MNSIKNIKTISKALGKEKTKKNLIPFLKEMIDESDDVVLALLDNILYVVDTNDEFDLILPIIE